ADIFRFAAFGERLGLLDPVVAVNAALEIQISVDPFAFGRLPGSNLREGEDAELVQRALNLRTDAGDQLQIVQRNGTFDAGRAIRVVERRLAAFSAGVALDGGVGGGLGLRRGRRLQRRVRDGRVGLRLRSVRRRQADGGPVGLFGAGGR